MRLPDPSNIRRARDFIDPAFLDTPLISSVDIDAAVGASVVFKDETATPIKSFKGRGACHFLSALEGQPRIVCASAGNFGQALAWAARQRGLDVTVYAARSAVRRKVDAMCRLGARVRLDGDDFDAAKAIARECAARDGALYVEDGAHAEIAEGAGTIALELTESGEQFDAVLAPLGNGALASGLGTWLKTAAPESRMIAVATTGAPAMARSVQTGRYQETRAVRTIADGIAVRVPIRYAIKAVRAVTDEVVLVADDALRSAMRMLRDELGLTVEAAGAAGLAALLANPSRWRGMRIAVPLCGGNVDPDPATVTESTDDD